MNDFSYVANHVKHHIKYTTKQAALATVVIRLLIRPDLAFFHSKCVCERHACLCSLKTVTFEESIQNIKKWGTYC